MHFGYVVLLAITVSVGPYMHRGQNVDTACQQLFSLIPRAEVHGLEAKQLVC